MAPAVDSGVDGAALARRQAMTGASGPAALVKNVKEFGIACFACLGGLVYGYNQGVLSCILTMSSFGTRMGMWVEDQTKKGWLTPIFEPGAWFGCLYSGFIAETLSRKYAIMANVVLFTIGVVIQCLGVVGGPSALLAGRFIVGLAVGAMSVLYPIITLKSRLHKSVAAWWLCKSLLSQLALWSHFRSTTALITWEERGRLNLTVLGSFPSAYN